MTYTESEFYIFLFQTQKNIFKVNSDWILTFYYFDFATFNWPETVLVFLCDLKIELSILKTI